MRAIKPTKINENYKGVSNNAKCGVYIYGMVYTGAIIANIDTNTNFLFVKGAYAFSM